MLSTVTPEKLKEKSFQKLIKEYLVNENDYVESANVNYDKYHALDKEMLFQFSWYDYVINSVNII